MRTLRILITALILLCLPFTVGAAESEISFYGAIDVMALDSLWRQHLSLRCSVGAMIADGIGVEFPASCIFDQSGGDEILLDFALKLLVHPWGHGPFIALSLTQLILFTGAHVPQEPIHYLNEIAFGYTWEFSSGWFVRPSLIYREPSDGAPESFAYVSTLVPTRKRLQLCVDVLWVFASIRPDVDRG